MDNIYLNLEFRNDSNIKYRIKEMSDGQRSITLNHSDCKALYNKPEVIIIKNINDFKDLELICSTVSALRAYTKNYSLYSPFIVGSRSDRKFEDGGDWYFDDIIVKILNTCRFNDIYTFDNYCSRPEITSLSLWKTSAFYSGRFGYNLLFLNSYAKKRFKDLDVISSDYLITEETNVDSKTIKDLSIINSCFDSKRIVIFDNMFDGGEDFLEVCEAIRERCNEDMDVYIFVTHFIGCSKEVLDRLKELRINIYTSNSYKFECDYNNIFKVDLFNLKLIDKLI